MKFLTAAAEATEDRYSRQVWRRSRRLPSSGPKLKVLPRWPSPGHIPLFRGFLVLGLIIVIGMADRDGIQFKIGEAFPPDDRLARWVVTCSMALNDLLLVNRWLIPRLEGKEPSDGYEQLYLARLASLHLFEISTFLRQANRFPEVHEFVGQLEPETQNAYRALLNIAKGASGEFANQVEHARNYFSHYAELLPDDAAVHEHLRQAIKVHADEGSVGQILDTTPPITGFRALFADDIAAELTFPDSDKEELEKFVGELSEHIAQFLIFVRAALPRYAAKLPDDAWEDWNRDQH